MNHWFLTGRDIMWVAVYLLPLILCYWAGQESKESVHGVEYNLIFVGVLWQILFVVLLYNGVIR